MTTEKTKKIEGQDFQLMEIDKITPYEFNSKKHSEENIKGLMASISQHGLSQPITLDKHNVIIGGHGRLEACKRLGMRFVKVLIHADLNEQQVKELRIAENKTASTEYDTDLLKLELEAMDLQDINVEALGFSKEEFDKFTATFDVMDLEALSQNLDDDIDAQIKEAEQDIKKADKQTVSVVSALGFKNVSADASRKIARFVANLQDDYDLPADEAFVRFIEDLQTDSL